MFGGLVVGWVTRWDSSLSSNLIPRHSITFRSIFQGHVRSIEILGLYEYSVLEDISPFTFIFRYARPSARYHLYHSSCGPLCSRICLFAIIEDLRCLSGKKVPNTLKLCSKVAAVSRHPSIKKKKKLYKNRPFHKSVKLTGQPATNARMCIYMWKTQVRLCF